MGTTGTRADVRVTNRSVTDEGVFVPFVLDPAATYVEWYLSASRSAITDVRERDGRTYYLVETIGNLYPGAENARASVLVDSWGIVHRLRAERELPDSDVKVVMTFQYTDIGNTTVRPPAWYNATDSIGATDTTDPAEDTATNATDAGTTTEATARDTGSDREPSVRVRPIPEARSSGGVRTIAQPPSR